MNVHVRELARAMSDQGAGVDIFVREHDAQESDASGIAGNVHVVHIPAGPPNATLFEQFDHLPNFLSGVLEHQQRQQAVYTAVHSHYWMSGWAGLRLAAKLGVPHLSTFHTLSRIKVQSRSGEREPPIREQTETEIISDSDCVIVFSEHERDSIVRLYNGNTGRIRLVPCGVDLGRFYPLGRMEARSELGLNGHKILLFVGRIEALKGLDLLIHTAAHLDASDLKVLVVGDDADGSGDLTRLREMANNLNIGGSVEFLGRVARSVCPGITRPRMFASSRPTMRVSGWSPWRVWRVAHRSLPRGSAVCPPSSSMGKPGTSSRGAAPKRSPVRSR